MPDEYGEGWLNSANNPVEDHGINIDKIVNVAAIYISISVFVILVQIPLVVIPDIMPFITISEASMSYLSTDYFWIFIISSITAVFSLLCAIFIIISAILNYLIGISRRRKGIINLFVYYNYFILLLIALLLLLSLEIALIYSYSENFAQDQDGKSTVVSINSTLLKFDTINVDQREKKVQNLKKFIDYYPAYGNNFPSFYAAKVSDPEYLYLGNYSVDLSNYVPLSPKKLKIDIENLNSSLSRIDFSLSGKDMESLILAEFERPVWSNFIDKTMMQADIEHLWILLTVLVELTFKNSIHESTVGFAVENPYPGIIILDAKSGIKGYAGVVSAGEVILLMSTASDETFCSITREIKVIPLENASLVRLEKMNEMMTSR
ncbi:MAG: hypothetical protein PHW87_00055 [Methanothrix sp.]|nr:hypothetical protein [Methanothrix sp.]